MFTVLISLLRRTCNRNNYSEFFGDVVAPHSLSSGSILK